MTVETAWLIEKRLGGHPVWFCAGSLHWSPESLSAVRFARKEDAEKMIAFWRDADAFASEHRWGFYEY